MMELRHAPIPSLRGWWADVRNLLWLDDEPEDLPRAEPRAAWRPRVRPAAVPARPPQWGAADHPELLLGDCEPATALWALLEEIDRQSTPAAGAGALR